MPRTLSRPGRQASTRKRLHLKLKVGPQIWDQQNPREQQTLAVPPGKPRKQASSKTKCTANPAQSKYSQESKVGQTQGNGHSDCTSGLVALPTPGGKFGPNPKTFPTASDTLHITPPLRYNFEGL